MAFATSTAAHPLDVGLRDAPGRHECQFIGSSPASTRLREMVQRVASSSSTVMVLGESGTGKEVLARLLHGESSRVRGPFVAVNCGALPESLVEAEFFGYERGAFTGAARAKPGLFEQAHGGTLFLDEVTECSSAVQVKLLRAIQEREVQRLGGVRKLRVDVRIVAASNRPLEEALREGLLREDLYYRLRVVDLYLPPLRERRADILPLSRHFLQKYGALNRSALRTVGVAALQALEAYDWPGNVRELENAIERATVLAPVEDGLELLPSHLPHAVQVAAGIVGDLPSAESHLDLEVAIERLRRRYVTEALRLADGNKTEAARLLGISRRGLYNLLDGGMLRVL